MQLLGEDYNTYLTEKGIILPDDYDTMFADAAACTYCALCETLCPEGAITCAYIIVCDSGSATRA